MDNLLQKLLLGGSAVALLSVVAPVAAQAQGGDADIEQVVVSASRISIAGYSQPTPVTVVGAAQLEKDAYSNIADAVRELPALTSPPSSYSAGNGGGSSGQEGASLLNLRNLGTSRTLVLFDGARVAIDNIVGAVDIQTLPSEVITRVDVVTGGASAAWGSDAVAGVVNFVLNKNYDGFKANVEFGDTSNGLYRSWKIGSMWGGDLFGGRGHFVVAADYTGHPDDPLQKEENWYRGSYWVSNPAYVAGNGQPQLIVANDVGIEEANQGGIIVSSPAVTAANSPTGLATAANVLRGIEFVGNGVPQLVNFGNQTLGVLSNGGSLTSSDGENNWTPVGQPSKIYSFFGFGRYKLTDNVQASVQLNYGYFSGQNFAQNLLQTGLVVHSDNAFLPASVRATMTSTGITSFNLGVISSNNLPESVSGSQIFKAEQASLGTAAITSQRQMMRGVFTLEGSIGDNWSWTAFYQHSTVRFWSHAWGDARLANTTAAEDSVTVTTANRGTSGLPLGSIACRSSLTNSHVVVGAATSQSGCIPLDIFGNGVASPNAIAYAVGHNTDFTDMQNNEDQLEGSMQGTLPWELPAGKVAVAFGAGYRKEAGVNFADPAGAQADFAVANFIYFPSSNTNMIEGFAEINAPILKNNIVQSLDLNMAGRMTSYSNSGLVETWKLGLTSQVTDDFRLRTSWSVDIRAPNIDELFALSTQNNGSAKDPKTQLTATVFSNVTGNTNLVPEVARTITGGVVFTPSFLQGFSLSADWYSINVTGEIASISAGTIENQCNATIPSVIYPGTLGNPNDPLCTHLVFQGNNGALSEVVVAPINIDSQTVSGIDLEASYNMDFWNGTLGWHAVSNYTDENTTTQPGAGTNDSAGSGGSPKWKGILSVDYTTGPYSFTVQSRWFGTSKFSNTANTGNLATPATSNLYDPAHYEIPMVGYLDLRVNYKWNDNISFFSAMDNALDTPPALVPLTSGNVIHSTPTNTNFYDLLGRQIRVGVRFNY